MELTDGITKISLSGDIRAESLVIGGARINNLLSPLPSLEGARLAGGSIGERALTLEGYICADLEQNRRMLCKLCTLGRPFYLLDGEYRLELVLSSGVRFASERRFKDKLLRFTIEAIAPSPYWEAAESQRHLFYSLGATSNDDNALRITNIGDMPCGFRLTVLMATSANFLVIRKSDKRITLNLPLNLLDTVIIDTRSGKKSVTVIPDGQSEGVSAIEYVMPSSEFFGLDAGDNRIDFVVSEGVAHMTLEYTPRYLR